MKSRKNNLEVGQRVYVDFLSSNQVETDGTRISGFGVLDRVETDGFVCGRLDNGQPFGCQSEYVQLQTKVIGIDLGEDQPEVEFKTGDFVVLVDEGTKDWLLQVIDYMYTPDMYRVKILATGQCGPLFKNGMRHATDEEIAAGHRIDKSTLLQHLDKCVEVVKTWPKWKIESVRNVFGIPDTTDDYKAIEMEKSKAEYLEFYREELGNGKHCTKSFGLAVWQHQQAKVVEKNKLLIDQGQRFNDQSQYVKDLEHKNYELQKRLDGSLQEIAGATRWIQEDAIDDTEFLKGGVLAAFRRIEQTLKVGHSIFFEAGDKVVFDNRIVSDDILTIDEILEDGVKFRGNFFHARYLNQMRHATSEEIALGRRIITLSSED